MTEDIQDAPNSYEMDAKDNWRKLYDVRDTPYWKDMCGHGGYLFSLTTLSDKSLDVYCFDDSTRQTFCLRYGPQDSDYYSPGNIEMLLQASNTCYDPWRSVMECLRKIGTIQFVKNDN